MNLEVWSKVYKKLLDKSSDAILVLDMEGKIVYANSELKSLCLGSMQEFMAKFTHIKKSKQPDPNTEYTTVTLRNETKSGQEEDIYKIIPVTQRGSLKDTILTKNDYTNLSELFDYIVKAQKAGLFLPEDDFIFQTKYTGSKIKEFEEEHSSFQIKISPLTENNRIIFVFTDSTYKEKVTLLEAQNQYKIRLLATVSHDMRTPLNGGINFLEASIADGSVSPKVKEELLIPASRSCKLLQYLVNDILDFSLMNAQKLRLSFEKLSIVETIKSCYQLLQLQAHKKGLRFNLYLDPKLPSIFITDHNRVGQILHNLLSNAVKFTPKGEIDLTVLSIGKDLIQIDVTDTGIGIKEEDQKKLFQPYTRIDYEQRDINNRGIGLGLMISNELAQKLGPPETGGIKVFSKFGQGTKFSFILQEKGAYEATITGVSIKLRSETIGKDSELPPVTRGTTNSSAPAEEMPESKGYPHAFHQNKTLSNLIQIEFGKQKNIFGIHQNVINIQSNLVSFHASNSNIPSNLVHMNSGPKNELYSDQKIKDIKVLVVDDDPLNILVMETLLKSLSVGYECALSGEDAVNKLKCSRGCNAACFHNLTSRFQLIFMDCHMPIMDGFEASRKITEMIETKEISPVPIIGCTADSQIDHFEACLESGMTEVMIKPISKDRLQRLLSKYL